MAVQQSTQVSLARLAARALKGSATVQTQRVRLDLRESVARLAHKAAKAPPVLHEALDQPALRALVTRDRLAARAARATQARLNESA